ncbi:Uncharacterised protein [Mycobacterium tuberculosis]|uniref:Uncharacterized protein n=1 Tax=Mycobacterium tuberculosis TaxID=1773 RepID=A0A655J8E6_MYCTX|nr:Uncharacterised protein [Mycobacterium tuberculosis]
MHEAISEPQRPEQAQHQAVNVIQRQTVDQHVLGRPLPGLCQCIEVGGDRPPAQLHAFGRPGGAGRVDHHGDGPG